MASFADSTPNQTAEIQCWALDELDKRMLFTGRAIEFVSNLDVEQKNIKNNVDIEVGRINSVVTEFNLVKDQFRAIHLTIKEKDSEQHQKSDEQQKQQEVMKQQYQKLEELTDAALKTMFSGTQEFALKSEQKLAELRRHTVEFGQKVVPDFDSAKRILSARRPSFATTSTSGP